MKRKHKMVYVEWLDSRNISVHWGTRKDSIKRAQKAELIRSVGFLIDDTKDQILIAMDYDATDDLVHSSATIPKGMIKKLREL